jgi:Baseplate J-like protein
MPTNVPSPTFGTSGFQAPLTSAVLAGTIADLNAAFNGTLNPALNTPQGQLASSLAAIIDNVNALFLLYTNLVDPALSSGRMQDAIGRIYFIERNPAQPTVLQVQCIGGLNVPIPVGAQIQDPSGNLYSCTEAGTIPASGSIILPFACNTVGPITVPTTAIIYQNILGWDAVIIVSGVEGNNVETPSQFEQRRSASTATNSLGALPSILGSVLSVANVIDAIVVENTAPVITTIDGVLLGPNSIYVVVVGGLATAVAQAIWAAKAPGCNYNGQTQVVVQDTSLGYVPPYPSYTVSFDYATGLPVIFNVVIKNSTSVPSNANSLIQNAIVGAFAGLDGGPRATIGTELFASRFYSTVAALGPWAQIITIQIGAPSAPSATFNGSITGTTLTVNSISFGNVALGQSILDLTGDVVPGTTVTAYGTGSGGIGTYTVSNTQTVASEIMYGCTPSQNEVNPFLNQIPTIFAANITVSLGT